MRLARRHARADHRVPAADRRARRAPPTGPARSGGPPGPGFRTAFRDRRSIPSMLASRGRPRRVGGSVARPGLGPALHGLRRPGGRPRPVHARKAAGRRPHATHGRGPGRAAARLPRRPPARCGEAGEALGIHPNALRYAAMTGTVLIRWDGARQPTVWTVPRPEVDPRTPASSSRGATCTPSARPRPGLRRLGRHQPRAALAASTRSARPWSRCAPRSATRSSSPPTRRSSRARWPAGLRPGSFRAATRSILLQGADRELLVPDPRIAPPSGRPVSGRAPSWSAATSPARGAGPVPRHGPAVAPALPGGTRRGRGGGRDPAAPGGPRRGRGPLGGRLTVPEGGAPQARDPVVARQPSAVCKRPEAGNGIVLGASGEHERSGLRPGERVRPTARRPAASANALCLFRLRRRGRAGPVRAPPVSTCPCVTAPVATSVTTGRPSGGGDRDGGRVRPRERRAAVRMRQTPW